MDQQNVPQKFVKVWNEICKKEEEIKTKKRKMIDEKIDNKIMKNDMAAKKEGIIKQILKEMTKKDEENAKLKKENHIMKLKLAKIEADLKANNISVHRRVLPIELMNELFGSLPLEIAFSLLAKMPNGLLARNVQKMIKSIKMALKNNKCNKEDCGSRLEISEDGLDVKHSGISVLIRNMVRTILPIPTFNLDVNKPTIYFYFEVQIHTNHNRSWQRLIRIGLYTQQFPLEGNLLDNKMENLIEIPRKVAIIIDGAYIIFDDDNGLFKNGDFIGIGIINSPPNSSMQCFVTLNGELLGKAELPSKFSTLQLFPAVNLVCGQSSIRANFGKEQWRFKEFKFALEMECNKFIEEDEEEDEYRDSEDEW